MAESRKFHWIAVDRDRTPALPKRFHVSAYPSLLVLGHEGENVYRFHGFKPPEVFLPELAKGLARWSLYTEGKEWDVPEARELRLTEAGRVRTLPAPSLGVPAGIAVVGGDLWVAQGDELFVLGLRWGRHKRTIRLRPMTQDIATDGKVLYTVDSAWTKGAPIQVIEPGTGRVVREVVTKANLGGRQQSARGLCWRNGKLWVLEIFGKLHEVDPRTGEVSRSLDTGKHWVFGLAFDGEHLVMGGRDAIYLVDPETGRIVREVPVHHRLRAVGFHGGEYWAMEQPEWGFDRRHERIRVWPGPGGTFLYRIRLDG